MHILIAEDEKSLALSLQKSFAAEGIRASIVYNGANALQFLDQEKVDLLLLDWRMPELSGLEVCQRIRSRGDKIPIILLTALNDVSNKVEALTAGADDYITKPFSFRELMARIQAVSRRFQQTTNLLRFGECTLDLISHELHSSKGSVRLAEKEFDLLWYFIRNKNSILNKEQIAADVWNLSFLPATNFIEATIKNLRRKLSEITQCNHIKTVYGEGYTFIDE